MQLLKISENVKALLTSVMRSFLIKRFQDGLSNVEFWYYLENM